MTRKRLFLLSLLSGILLVLSWPPYGSPFLLFIAFVPLLQIEHAFSTGEAKAKRTLLFGLAYLSFFIWNITTTFWVCNASIGGGAAAILCNSLLMAITFWIFHIVKRRLLAAAAPAASNWLFPIFWLSFEFIHHSWELTWPWLALGNVFAAAPKCIQWYEYTGTCGGSLWVLAVNLMIFSLVKSGRWKMANGRWKILGITSGIIFPVVFSLFRYYSYGIDLRTKLLPDPSVNIVIVQPNIDPYSEKFSGVNYAEQLEKILGLAKQKVDSTTDYLVCPETSLTEDIWENDIKLTASIHRLKEFLNPFPKLKIVIGASTWYIYEEGETPSVTARKFTRQDGYYDAFNTALQVDNSDSLQIYHKSKLVPGVERMPYPQIFGFLGKISIDLGGMSGSLGTQDERAVFKSPLSSGRGAGGEVAPVICYESIFGEFVTGYVKNGANLIFIITNDGWWGDTPGYMQHLIYGRLRAIETRRSIARSANTGISCFINQRGDISQETEWWKPAVLKGSINKNSAETFYVRHGDIIWRVCFYVSVIVLLFAIGARFFYRK